MFISAVVLPYLTVTVDPESFVHDTCVPYSSPILQARLIAMDEREQEQEQEQNTTSLLSWYKQYLQYLQYSIAPLAPAILRQASTARPFSINCACYRFLHNVGSTPTRVCSCIGHTSASAACQSH